MRRSEMAERCRSGQKLAPAKFEVEARGVRSLCETGPFASDLEPDEWKKYIEFDICHSLPVVAGPAYLTGNYLGYHPAVLAQSHKGLIHQQTNLHHLLRAYDQNVTHDRIVGCVVATHYPDEPEGGWKIPATKEEAIPIHACAVMWRVAHGAIEVLKELTDVAKKWSVSIEVLAKSLEDLGIYVPSTGVIEPLLSAPDDLLDAVSIDQESGTLRLGKHRSGEQLVLAYGCADRKVTFQGVGYTPTPAEAEARITQVRLSSIDLSAAIAELGGRLKEICTSGKAYLWKGDFHGLDATPDDPVVVAEFRGKRALLRQSTIIDRLAAKKSAKKD